MRNYPLTVSFVVLTLFFCFVGYSVLEKDPISVETNSYGNDSQVIACGEPIILNRTVCASKPLSITIKRSFSYFDIPDQQIINVDDGYYTIISARCEDVVFPVAAPSFLKDGNYIYQATISYRVNHFKNIIKKVPPEHFEVYRPEGCK